MLPLNGQPSRSFFSSITHPTLVLSPESGFGLSAPDHRQVDLIGNPGGGIWNQPLPPCATEGESILFPSMAKNRHVDSSHRVMGLTSGSVLGSGDLHPRRAGLMIVVHGRWLTAGHSPLPQHLAYPRVQCNHGWTSRVLETQPLGVLCLNPAPLELLVMSSPHTGSLDILHPPQIPQGPAGRLSPGTTWLSCPSPPACPLCNSTLWTSEMGIWR